MKNILEKISFILFALLFSCCATKKGIKSDDLTLINTFYEQGDIPFLIRALDEYPLHRGHIETLLFDNDYSDVHYGQLKTYAEIAKSDAIATMFFDSLLIHKQALIIDSLSYLDVAEVGAFYKANYIEHDYLKDLLFNTYFNNVYSLDYKNRKALYKAFQGTDLSTEIEKPYRELRDSLLAEIMGVFNPYFESERELLKQIEKAVRYESQKYVETGIEKIINAVNSKNDRGFFQKIFKREDIDNYSFEEYVNKITNETYDYSYIEKQTKERLSEYIVSSRTMRSMIFNQYFNESEYQNIYITNEVLKTPLIWTIGRNDVSAIQDIKDMGTALTIGSFALGLIPGIGQIAVAADVADLIYGIGEDEKINNAVDELANTIYNDSSFCISDYLNNIFKLVAESQQTTENNIRNIFDYDF